MFQHEILIAPLLEARIKIRVGAVAGAPDGLMEMCGVIGVRVAWCQICSSAEPLSVALLQISKVRVNRRNHGTPRMKYERDACRKKLSSAAERNLGRELFRQVAMN